MYRHATEFGSNFYGRTADQASAIVAMWRGDLALLTTHRIDTVRLAATERILLRD